MNRKNTNMRKSGQNPFRIYQHQETLLTADPAEQRRQDLQAGLCASEFIRGYNRLLSRTATDRNG